MKNIKFLPILFLLISQSIYGWEQRFYIDDNSTNTYKIIAYRYDLSAPLFGVNYMMIEGSEYDTVYTENIHSSPDGDYDFWLGFDYVKDTGDDTDPFIGEGLYEYRIYRNNELVFKFKIDLRHRNADPWWSPDIIFYYTYSTSTLFAKSGNTTKITYISSDEFIGCWTIHDESRNISKYENNVFVTNSANNQRNNSINTKLTSDIWGFPYDDYSINDEFTANEEINFWRGATYGLEASMVQYIRNDSIYKFRHWDNYNELDINSDLKILSETDEIKSLYFNTHPLTVHNYLEGSSGGSYNVTWTTPSPQIPQGTFQSLENFNAFDSLANDDKYQITINQTIPGQYGTNWEFQYWDDGSTSLTRGNIAVSEPTTLKAYYKALMHSSYQNTLANQNQKQVLKLDNNSIILAYQSNNKVWLEVQPSAGASWFDYFDAAESKLPSLAADFTPGNENNFYLAYQEVIDASTSKIKIRYFDGGGNNLHSYEVKTVTHSSNADLQPVIIKNNGDKVLVVWREDGYGNAGLNYKYIKHTPNTSWTVKQTGIINNTNNVSLDPCLAIERTSNNPNWNPIHLVWQQGLASINYIRINQKGELFNQSEYANISSGSGYSINYNPALTLELNQGNYYPQVSWIGNSSILQGYYGASTVKKVVKRGKNQNGIWGFFYNVGDDVVFQTSNYAGGDHITAWSEGTSNYTIKFIKNRLYSTTHSLGSTDKYLDLSNGTSLSNMYAYTMGISSQPYRFTKSSSIGSLISKETAVEISSGRQGVAYVDTAEFYFALGDIKCNGQQIDFVDIVDSNYTADLENVNYYMKSKPFAVDNNSSLIYSVYYGLTDSLYSTEILEEGSYVNFRVQLVDVGNNEVIGEYDNITYDRENLDKYANTAYTIDMSGIGERTVQIRLVVNDNLEGGYGVSNIFGDGMLFGKNTTPIEQNFQGSLEIKDYHLS
ncbi:MAG: hypothetical protein K8F36_08280 [Melioribacteraceae bacterium]|nr:hypothetical protein [Melioribacteraceae bacterium]